MRTFCLVLFVVLSARLEAQLIWDKDEIFAENTQTFRIHLGESPAYGVLLLKHYKYGRPLYLISTFIDRTVDQTKMVTQEMFYKTYANFHEIMDTAHPVAEKCRQDLSVTRKLGDKKVHQHRFCSDKLDVSSRKALKKWYGSLKGGI